MWTLWALLGCGQPSASDGEETVAADVDLELYQERLDFGFVPRGQTAKKTLTIHNNGTSDLLLAELVLSDPDTLAVHGLETLRFPAGEDTQLTVEWTPSETGDLVDDWVRLRVSTQLAPPSDIEVPLVGQVSGPRLALSESSLDLGAVTVGCSKTVETMATNSGNEKLEIYFITIDNETDLVLEDGTGAPLQFPIELEPLTSKSIDLVYTPMTDQIVSTTLEITSSDAFSDTTTIGLEGESDIEAEYRQEWTVQGQQAVTAIINVNGDALIHGFDDDMEDFLPVLFAGLNATHIPYRLAIVMNDAGYVSGDVEYIDDSFTVDEAIDAAEEMLDDAFAAGDNDAGLETCLNALDENDWLWEDDLWTWSRLNLMVITPDAEQSPGNAEHYVEAYGTYKNAKKDTGDFAVHGIAGPEPVGCDDKSEDEWGRLATNLIDAVTLSGGVFGSICDDWNKSVPALIDAFTGSAERFTLDEGEPAPGSIQVRVDGVQLFEGWTYDEKTKEIVFDDEAYPPHGSQLSVDYLAPVSCPE
jgi:hypothetical protein